MEPQRERKEKMAKEMAKAKREKEKTVKEKNLVTTSQKQMKDADLDNNAQSTIEL